MRDAGQPYQVLPKPSGYTSSLALDVNDHGVVVGVVSPVTTPTLQPHAAVWRPSAAGYTVQVLGEPAGMQYSAATGINNLGDIVGSAGTTPWFRSGSAAEDSPLQGLAHRRAKRIRPA
jgi:hypothetical protein